MSDAEEVLKDIDQLLTKSVWTYRRLWYYKMMFTAIGGFLGALFTMKYFEPLMQTIWVVLYNP